MRRTGHPPKLIWFLVCLLATGLSSCMLQASTLTAYKNNVVPQELGKAALINLDGYYFLYMYPVPPFINEGRVFVPLDRFAALLAVDTVYTYGLGAEKAPARVKLSRGNTTVALDKDSVITMTDMDTERVTVPSYSGAETLWQAVRDDIYGVYIALEIFKDAFNINITYDANADTYFVIDDVSEFTKKMWLADFLNEVKIQMLFTREASRPTW